MLMKGSRQSINIAYASIELDFIDSIYGSMLLVCLATASLYDPDYCFFSIVPKKACFDPLLLALP